jgi:hypothetical protein
MDPAQAIHLGAQIADALATAHYTFPVETSQKPYFSWLGTPEKDKRHVVYDAAHDVMVNRTPVVKEMLSWLDQYLGPVGR